ncbi:MAG: alpha-L-fucosidase [Akkermansiaceae bacterium]
MCFLKAAPLFVSSIVCIAGAAHAIDLVKISGVSKDSNRAGFVFAAAKQRIVTEQITIPHEVSSVCSFVIDDGPDAVDVVFQSGINEAGGACGFSKSGTGTLRIEGDVSLGGVMTIYEGILDLSAARLREGARINLMGGAKLIEPSQSSSKIELYRNGEKVDGKSRRTDWMSLKYGIFSHYVWNGYGMTAFRPNEDGTVAKTIDELANAFDVTNYVNQLIEAKAQYVVFTAWHSGTCPLFPSAAMKKWAPDRVSCPQRDLLGDLLDECRKRGIPAFFYCHPYQPVVEPHNDWINDLFAELIDRYGDRLHGLWIDENFQDCTQDKVVDYPRLMRTIKERNPDLILTHNNGGFQSYGVDEGVQEVQWEFHEGRESSVYQIFSQTAKSPEDMLITTAIQAAANRMGGGIQWSIDALGGSGEKKGGLDPAARPILDGFVKLLTPIAESIHGTQASTSFLPPYRGVVVRYADLTWGVATKSADDQKEYLHVLKAPEGPTLQLPPAADGKVFSRARLLDGGQVLQMQQSNRGISLTLPQGVEWKKPDTVIVMDAMTPGAVGCVNNTSRAIRYEGPSWRYDRNLARREYRGDRHEASANGSAFHFTFEGTDVAWIGTNGPESGEVEISIDGATQGKINLQSERVTSGILYSKANLARGKHTLSVIKRSGKSIHVDAFRVSDLINDGDPDFIFSETSRHDARSAALEGLWEPRGASWINGHTFTFSFHGTSVEVLGGSAHGSGDLALTIDGKEHSTVHCHSGQTSRTLASITGLTNQPHVLIGKYINPHPAGFISALDGFIVTRPDYWSQQKNRGTGEWQDDAHVSFLKNATGHLTFSGSGVEVISTRDTTARTAHYVLENKDFSIWMSRNHYAPVAMVGMPVCRFLHLSPGKHTIHFTNASNSSGIHYSQVQLTMDAVRVHKGESSSASPLFWGDDARGGSGEWDELGAKNWNDGAMSVDWQDHGAMDHCAVFAGKSGQVRLKKTVRLNRMEFLSDGYHLRDHSIQLTGDKPTIYLAEHVTAHIASQIVTTDGNVLTPGVYQATTHPAWLSGKGKLVIGTPK